MVKFSILENIALYFQNLIERLFLCARSLTLARKNFRSFPGQVPGPFFKIYISIQITLFFDFFRYLYRDRYLQERLGREPFEKIPGRLLVSSLFRFSTFSIPVVSYLYETLYSVSRIQI